MKPLLPTFRKPWAVCVGSDRISSMLRTEYWERFRAVQAVMHYQYIRCHGLLGDELGLVRSDQGEGKTRTFYNFSYLDQIFDTLLAQGVKPFVEWGFMPEALASGSQTVFWWKGNVTPPRNQEDWANLVQTVTRHWVSRYGAAEVRSWLFEVWNEPNLTQFWKDADQRAYFALYETTVVALKSVDLGLRVGGPAICGGSDHWIDEFLAFIQSRNLPLDFFSRHLYSGQPAQLVTPDLYYQGLAAPQVPVDELKSVRRRIDRAGFPHLPLHITEFNTSYHPLCPVHDTPLNAAHLAQLLSEAGDWAESLSYWTFSDLFEEADVPRSFFHGGFGLLAREGVPKPTYHLFAFFRQLGDELVLRTERTVVTRTPTGLAAAAWNPVQSTDGGPSVVTIELPWAGTGPVLIRRSRVHERAANPWAVWTQLGRPRFPDRATVEFLRLAAQPAVETQVLVPVNGVIRLELTLEKNEVTLVEAVAFEDESGSYWGLDDGLIDGYQTGVQR
jgi:xylan 1,4-beta-xylosidase